MPFLDSVLPVNYSAQFNVGLRFNNTISQLPNGARVYRIGWAAPLRTYTLSNQNLTETDATNLSNFFKTVKGANADFLHSDLLDYHASKEPEYHLGLNTCYTQGHLYEYGTNEYLLCKKYVLLTGIHYRPITHAIDATIEVYDGDTQIDANDWDYEYKTGRLTTTVALTDPKVTFEFYTLVHFRGNSLTLQAIKLRSGSTKRYRLESLVLEETSTTPIIYPQDVFVSDLAEHNFMLWFWYEANLDTIQDTLIINADSGRQGRFPQNNLDLKLFRMGQRTTIKEVEMAYLLTVWLVCKGSGSRIGLVDITDGDTKKCVRFENQELSYQQTATAEKNTFSVSNLQARESLEPIAEQIPGFPDDDYGEFFGFDFGDPITLPDGTPLPQLPYKPPEFTPNTDQAKINYLAIATEAGVEDFESFGDEQRGLLNTSYPPTAITATMGSSDVVAETKIATKTNPTFGRYNTVPPEGQMIYQSAKEMTWNFSTYLKSFGIHLTDMGDFGEIPTIELYRDGFLIHTFIVPIPPATPETQNQFNANSSFYGFGTNDPNRYFDRIIFTDGDPEAELGFSGTVGIDGMYVEAAPE